MTELIEFINNEYSTKERKDHTRKEIMKVMNGILGFLKFTTETEDDYEDGYIPTLDMSMRMMNDSTLTYKFYEKPMGSKLCVGNNIAMSEQAKELILSQEA